VSTLDPEMLIGKLRVYVGDAVQWTPEYVEVDGHQVLVVVVDPPRPGDPIHSLRKQLEKFSAGTIFVRHTGRTDPHTPGDLDMLQARLLERTPSLQLTVAAVPAMIEATPDFLSAVDQWVRERRPALLSARHKSPQRGLPGLDLKELRASFDPLAPTIKADTRTKEKYAEQIEKFLDAARSTLVDRALWDLLRHAPALLHLQVNNPTDLGYTGIRLTVHVPGQVKRYPDELIDATEGDRPEMPQVPKPLGTPRVVKSALDDLASGLGKFPMPYMPDIGRYTDPGPGYTIRDSGSVTIDYDEFDVRPHETLTLDSVPLIVHEDVGTVLAVTCSATAAQVRGRLSGEFEITIGASTLDLSKLDHKRNSDM
jgi:hypothetical protein